ncbi:hypothetical protein GF314_03520 [bacterium]|nr:hypothetical protein [bacterium]
MNAKHLVTGLVLVLSAAGLTSVLLGGNEGDGGLATDVDDPPTAGTETVADDDGLPDDGLVVYYFHGYKRCPTCNKIEALAEKTIWEGFDARLRDGTIVFRAVNIETDDHRHFVQDYALATKVVVISERRDGREVGWRRLDEVWQKIGDDDAYRRYIASNVRECLGELGLEAG